jgi:hypothetical protein
MWGTHGLHETLCPLEERPKGHACIAQTDIPFLVAGCKDMLHDRVELHAGDLCCELDRVLIRGARANTAVMQDEASVLALVGAQCINRVDAAEKFYI